MSFPEVLPAALPTSFPYQKSVDPTPTALLLWHRWVDIGPCFVNLAPPSVSAMLPEPMGGAMGNDPAFRGCIHSSGTEWGQTMERTKHGSLLLPSSDTSFSHCHSFLLPAGTAAPFRSLMSHLEAPQSALPSSLSLGAQCSTCAMLLRMPYHPIRFF